MSADLQELISMPSVKNDSPARVSSQPRSPRRLPVKSDSHKSLTPSTTPPSTEKSYTSIFHAPKNNDSNPIVNETPAPSVPKKELSHFQKTCWSVLILSALPLLAVIICFFYILGTAWALLFSIWFDTPLQQGPILKTPDMPIVVEVPDAPKKRNKRSSLRRSQGLGLYS